MSLASQTIPFRPRNQEILSSENSMNPLFCSGTWSAVVLPTMTDPPSASDPNASPLTSYKTLTSRHLNSQVPRNLRNNQHPKLEGLLKCINEKKIVKYGLMEATRDAALETASWIVRITRDDTIPLRRTYIVPSSIEEGRLVEVSRSNSISQPTFMKMFSGPNSMQPRLECSHEMEDSKFKKWKGVPWKEGESPQMVLLSTKQHRAKCEFFERKKGT